MYIWEPVTEHYFPIHVYHIPTQRNQYPYHIQCCTYSIYVTFWHGHNIFQGENLHEASLNNIPQRIWMENNLLSCYEATLISPKKSCIIIHSETHKGHFYFYFAFIHRGQMFCSTGIWAKITNQHFPQWNTEPTNQYPMITSPSSSYGCCLLCYLTYQFWNVGLALIQPT